MTFSKYLFWMQDIFKNGSSEFMTHKGTTWLTPHNYFVLYLALKSVQSLPFSWYAKGLRSHKISETFPKTLNSSPSSLTSSSSGFSSLRATLTQCDASRSVSSKRHSRRRQPSIERRLSVVSWPKDNGEFIWKKMNLIHCYLIEIWLNLTICKLLDSTVTAINNCFSIFLKWNLSTPKLSTYFLLH